MEFLLSLPLLQIHISAVFTTLILVVISDVHALLWVIGKIPILPRKRMELFHKAVWLGLVVIVSAGLLMFSTYSEYLLTLPAFKIKMLLVVLLIVNAVFIGGHLQKATTYTFASLSRKEQIILLISGAVSSTGWIGAFIAAQFLS